MYGKIQMSNGVRIVYDNMPYVRSAAIGIWVGVGSRYESPAENGAAHFIEHMLFKGTSKYTAAELAGIMDGIGGQINAYTTRESTCFYARVLDTHLSDTIDLLCDMFFDSRLDQADVDSERGVIFEEIDMYGDTPEDLVTERLMSKAFRGALGRPILGKPSTLEGMTGESLRVFMDEKYCAGRIVVALAGSFEESHLRLIEERFSGMGEKKGPKLQKGKYTAAVTVKRKSTEQNHICIGFPGLKIGDDKRYATQIMSMVLGGGMSSRLFQTVRETHGLCYSIYSYASSFSDTGLFGIVTALGQETQEKALGLIAQELRRMRDGGITDQELDRAREQTKSNVVMGLESTTACMNRLGSGELHMGRHLTADQLIERYDAVTREDVLDAARQVIRFDELSFSAVGRVAGADDYMSFIGR